MQEIIVRQVSIDTLPNGERVLGIVTEPGSDAWFRDFSNSRYAEEGWNVVSVVATNSICEPLRLEAVLAREYDRE